MIKGKTVSIDATMLEANAALRSIVRRDTGESYHDCLTKLAQASGIETPTRADLAQIDRKRKKKGPNDDWTHPHDPDAKITNADTQTPTGRALMQLQTLRASGPIGGWTWATQILGRAGAHKLLFGSDGPWLHPGLELHKIRLLGLPEREQALILGGNAIRLIQPDRVRREETPCRSEWFDSSSPTGRITQRSMEVHATSLAERSRTRGTGA
jgi:hypothetical protein